MAPIHHHFEMKAWSETKIMVRFWIVAAILCALGFVLYYRYYLAVPPVRTRRSCSGSRARAGRRRRRSRRAGREVVAGRPDARATTTDLVAARRRRRRSSRAPAFRARRRSSRAARARGIPVWSEIELGARLLAEPDRRRHRDERQDDDDRAARRDARRAGRAGNVGRALTELVGAVEPRTRGSSASSRASSSRTSTSFAPRVAVLLNLEPDHLDRHGTFEAYRAAKLRDLREPGARTTSPSCRAASGRSRARRDASSSPRDDELPAEPLHPGRAQPRERRRRDRGRARAAGVDDEAIAEALRTFPGVPHRLELVARARRRPLRQRLEGDERRRRRRGARRVRRAAPPDPRRLAQGRALRRARRGASRRERRPAYLVGEAARELAAALGAASVPFELAATLERAVAAAAARRRAGRRRAALAGLRELRPVRELRGPRRGVPAARREPPSDESRPARAAAARPRHARRSSPSGS